jgi:hypothetical protein
VLPEKVHEKGHMVQYLLNPIAVFKLWIMYFFLPGTRTVVLAMDSGSAVEFLVAGMNFAVVNKKNLKVCEYTSRYFTLYFT